MFAAGPCEVVEFFESILAPQNGQRAAHADPEIASWREDRKTRLKRVPVRVGDAEQVAQILGGSSSGQRVIEPEALESHAQVVDEGWTKDVRVSGHGMLHGIERSPGERGLISNR